MWCLLNGKIRRKKVYKQNISFSLTLSSHHMNHLCQLASSLRRQCCPLFMGQKHKSCLFHTHAHMHVHKQKCSSKYTQIHIHTRFVAFLLSPLYLSKTLPIGSLTLSPSFYYPPICLSISTHFFLFPLFLSILSLVSVSLPLAFPLFSYYSLLLPISFSSFAISASMNFKQSVISLLWHTLILTFFYTQRCYYLQKYKLRVWGVRKCVSHTGPHCKCCS